MTFLTKIKLFFLFLFLFFAQKTPSLIRTYTHRTHNKSTPQLVLFSLFSTFFVLIKCFSLKNHAKQAVLYRFCFVFARFSPFFALWCIIFHFVVSSYYNQQHSLSNIKNNTLIQCPPSPVT